MRWSVVLALAVVPAFAWGYTADVGNVAVIEDVTGEIHSIEGFWGPDRLCREAAKAFYQCHSDDYDVVVTFTSKPVVTVDEMIRNVQQGTPVRNNITGIGYATFDNTENYGRTKRLEQCVNMASLGTLPDSPDGPATALFGLPLGLTGVELLGHELGHRWLIGVEFDKNDGSGPQHFLRGYEGDPNLHYSSWADSHSVMYGNFITDNGDGSFTVCGGVRKYGPLDQYLMGLRPPEEVPPLLVLSDGSGQGSASVATPNGTCSNISSGMTRVDVSIEDVVRAMGPRTPAAAQAPHEWRVAFVLVTEAGKDATTAEVAKVDSYRTRFDGWFPTATDSRGSVDTTLGARECVAADGGAKPDAGTVVDGGTPPADGGTLPVDGGTPPSDGGTLPADGGAPPSDGGAQPVDAGAAPADAGTTSPDAGAGGRSGSGGCSCDASDGSAGLPLWLLLALSAAWALRRRRANRPRTAS